MKLFIYLFVAVLLIGGTYLLVVDHAPPQSSAAAVWSAEAQTDLANLLTDQIKTSQSNDWSAFDADLAKAVAHLAKAPADADSANFRDAIAIYKSQQQLRAQLPK
jgi:hypothetical protein